MYDHGPWKGPPHFHGSWKDPPDSRSSSDGDPTTRDPLPTKELLVGSAVILGLILLPAAISALIIEAVRH